MPFGPLFSNLEVSLLQSIVNKAKGVWGTFKTVKFYTMADLVMSKGFRVASMDESKEALVVSFEPPLCTLVYIDHDKEDSIRLESTLVFEADIVNLRTLSSIAHVSMSYGFGTSGLIPTGNKTVKLYLGKHVSFSTMKENLADEINNMEKCIKIVIGYIQKRVNQQNLAELDLSMFDNIDLSTFNPQLLGEKKDFMYSSWQKFVDDLTESSEEWQDIAGQVQELQACAEFEYKNKMHLSEVGSTVLDELIWNRNFLEASAAEGKFSIN